MRSFLSAAVLLFVGSVSAAGGLDFDYESFYVDGDLGRARIILKVTNNTGQGLGWVFAECAFLDKEKRAIDVVNLIGRNIPARGTAYLDGWSSDVAGIEQAVCRISNYR